MNALYLLVGVCLLSTSVLGLPQPQEEEDEGEEDEGEEGDPELVGGFSSNNVFTLGLKRPSGDEEDEESVAFFNSLGDDDLVGAPRSFNAVKLGLVTPVKDQRKCSSCAAFGSMAIIETCFKKLTKKNVILSEQQFVDCAFGFEGSEGCTGGAEFQTYLKWAAKKKTLVTTEDYPYRAVNQQCPSPRPVSDLDGVEVGKLYYTLNGNEEKLKSLVARFSIADASIWFNNASLANFRAYKGGIFTGCVSGETPWVGHNMAVVGYGTDSATGMDFWLMKNSWGTSWGEKGYVRMQRGRGLCELGSELAVIDCTQNGKSANLCEDDDCFEADASDS